MVKVVKDNLNEIVKLCERMQLKSLFLFGSGSDELKFKQESDLDFIYNFKKDSEGLILSGYDYFDLLFALEKITGKNIDLVAEDKISNKFFLHSVNKGKIRIY